METIEYRLLNKAILWTALGLLIGLFCVTKLPVFFECRWQAQYGHTCPTCYLSRALRLLLFGDMAQSAALHPGAIGIIVFLLGQIGLRIVQLRHSKPNRVVDLGFSAMAIAFLWFSLNLLNPTIKTGWFFTESFK